MLRELKSIDIPSMMNIEVRAFGIEAWSVELLQEELQSPGAGGYILEQGTIKLGYCLFITEGSVMNIESIATHPCAQGSGIGKQLMTAMIRDAIKANCRRVTLEVHERNDRALSWYERLGFKRYKRTIPNFYKDGGAAVRMRLNLTKAVCSKYACVPPAASSAAA